MKEAVKYISELYTEWCYRCDHKIAGRTTTHASCVAAMRVLAATIGKRHLPEVPWRWMYNQYATPTARRAAVRKGIREAVIASEL